MIRFTIPIIVEGRYDKAHLSSIVDANIITTDGFGVFKNSERLALIRALAKDGLILLTDSDGGGTTIRSHIKSVLPKCRIYDLYIPQIEGKEHRKSAPSKAGYLGVEGVPAELLRELFAKFAEQHPELTESGEAPQRTPVTSADLMELGLTGAGSASRRDSVAAQLSLPRGMTAKAFLSAVNKICDINRLKFYISRAENHEK